MLHRLFATQHGRCVIGVEVLADSDGGGHKVKVAGAIVSDQAGEQEGVNNAGAVEHVHDIIFRRAGALCGMTRTGAPAASACVGHTSTPPATPLPLPAQA